MTFAYLKLSLVPCAVACHDEGEKVHFHTIDRKTGDRIYTRHIDAVSGKTCEDDDQTEAHEKAEDDWVILEEDELDTVQLESARNIDINEFVEADRVEWVYYDSPCGGSRSVARPLGQNCVIDAAGAREFRMRYP